MDRTKEAANIIYNLNLYKKGQIKDYKFINIVCNYFDQIKDVNLTESDFKFLRYIANISGIPHFYNLLKQFNNVLDIQNFDLNTFSSILHESTLHIDENSMLHRYQKQIIDKFEINSLNRYFLSASTSFGKTHLVFEIIKKMRYSNVVLIFPTIALLTENLERILSNHHYKYFKEKYLIHTLSEVNNLGERNLFIYTPERYLSFLEKSNTNFDFNFAFVDEVYKIDNDYIIDEETKENERDVAYRLAVHYSLNNKTDVLFAGPYMEFSFPNTTNYNPSFNTFLHDNKISLINYNEYETVNKSYFYVKKNKTFPHDNKFNINYSSNKKTNRLIETVKSIINIHQNTIIYCANRGKNGGVEYYADVLINSQVLKEHSYTKYIDLIDHLSSNFEPNWILVKSLKHGIGIHHGLIPKYIQKEIINLFNNGLISVLISTTTITEGVNTSAKNLIVMHSKKGNKNLKKFDAKNIAGRAGRFGFHYSGRVIDLSNSLLNIIEKEGEALKHKNYDLSAPKEEIDLFYSNEKYLSDKETTKKREIITEQRKRNIPDFIMNQYKVISRMDKIKIYDAIVKLKDDDFSHINKLIRTINYKLKIDFTGFQIVLDVLKPIVKNQDLKFLIDHKGKNNNYSTLTYLVHYYLKDGFKGSVQYKLKNRETIDRAIQQTAKFIYSTLKYQTVKYLGVFNLMYKYFISNKEQKKIEDIAGIDKLIIKFEYNAITENGRIASDYGVPSKVVDYYEESEKKLQIKKDFDKYELEAFERIEKIFNKD
ncbi:helicase-related protein [Bacillus sp. FSL R7-0685]|uniref:helicase-related protein n=1 Tax=Bacillus sp. FSL R7-0685 TaxID=2921589 RepID=UPI0030FCA8A6